MGKVLITENYLSNIANALRNKTGTNQTFTPAQMAPFILSNWISGEDAPSTPETEITHLSFNFNITSELNNTTYTIATHEWLAENKNNENLFAFLAPINISDFNGEALVFLFQTNKILCSTDYVGDQYGVMVIHSAYGYPNMCECPYPLTASGEVGYPYLHINEGGTLQLTIQEYESLPAGSWIIYIGQT